MDNNKDIKVFSGSRWLFWIFTTYNSDRFRVADHNTLLRNISRAILFSACLVGLWLIFVTGIWYCFDCNLRMKEASWAIPISAGVIQLSTTYISFAMNNRKIEDTMAHIEEIIKNRRPFFPSVATIIFNEAPIMQLDFSSHLSLFFASQEKLVTRKLRPNTHSSAKYCAEQ